MTSTNNLIMYVMISCIILFILTAFLALQNHLVRIDQAIISWFDARTSSSIVDMMEMISEIGSGEFILGLTFIVAVLLLIKRMWIQLFFLLTVTFGGIAFNLILKFLFQRERPGEMSVIEVFCHSLEINSYSFPSGHTMRSVILFAYLIYFCYRFIQNKAIKLILITFLTAVISTVSLSRIIVGAHFPSDVIAAVTIAIAWFCFCLIVVRYYVNKFKNHSSKSHLSVRKDAL